MLSEIIREEGRGKREQGTAGERFSSELLTPDSCMATYAIIYF